MSRHWVVVAGLAPLWGCMASGVQFAGSRDPVVVELAELQVGAHPPEGARRLGRASVECSPLDPEKDFERGRLSDLSCSRPLLQAALREAAAHAGGIFASVPACEEKHSSGAHGTRVSWLGCDAEVWGKGSVPVAAKPEQPKEFVPESAQAPIGGAVQDAWQIEIGYWPAAKAARRATRDPEGVVEVDFPRVGQRRLGDVTAECDDGCAADSLRRGLRAAAAWVGASTLSGVHCTQQGGTRSCSANLSSPEVDEPGLAGNR